MILTFKKNYLLWAALIIAVALILSAFSSKKAHALGLLPFGGQMTSVNYCCNGIQIGVGDPDGGTFMLNWTTLATGFYADYNVFFPDGQYLLGNATLGGSCVIIGSYCESTSIVPETMTMVGSSL